MNSKHRKLILGISMAFGTAWLFGLLGSWGIACGWFNWLDQWDFSTLKGKKLAAIISWFGTPLGLAFSSGLMLGTLFILRLFQPGFILCLSLLTSAMANHLLKQWVGRLRPVQGPSSCAFPSGHAFVCTAAFGLFGWILAQHYPKRKGAIALLCSLFLGLIAFSRLHLGVHYTSDVLAGGALGIIWLLAFTPAVEFQGASQR